MELLQSFHNNNSYQAEKFLFNNSMYSMFARSLTYFIEASCVLKIKSREMTFSVTIFIIACMLSNVLFVNSDPATKPYYTAAVFEHNRFGSINDTANDIIQTNLAFYRKAAEVAKSKESDIIVFPEYGIIPTRSRKEIREYLEDIPDPKQAHVNPCNEIERFPKHPILRDLSCIAKFHSMFVVANMGDIKSCDVEEGCPSDGAFHFNTNVVFDRNGTLLLKYHKEHLFFETAVDPAREQPDPIFKTDFGTFATFTCFDILFEKMSKISHLPFVDGIVFPTFWVNTNPQFTSVQLWMSWSLGHNTTLLASNIQLPGEYSMGSGIFHGQFGPLAYTLNPDGKLKLVVARVPKGRYSIKPSDSSVTEITLEKTRQATFDGKDVRKMCSTYVLDYPDDANKDYRCMEEFTTYYNLVKLTESSGHVEVCHNGMCCSLNYSAESMEDNFYLGVYNGTHNSLDRYFWCEENCVVMRCEGLDDNPCAVFPRLSKTDFYELVLSANFTSSYIYPSVVSTAVRLVPLSQWNFTKFSTGTGYEAEINFNNQRGRSLIVAGLKGRCYDRDPLFEK